MTDPNKPLRLLSDDQPAKTFDRRFDVTIGYQHTTSSLTTTPNKHARAAAELLQTAQRFGWSVICTPPRLEVQGVHLPVVGPNKAAATLLTRDVFTGERFDISCDLPKAALEHLSSGANGYEQRLKASRGVKITSIYCLGEGQPYDQGNSHPEWQDPYNTLLQLEMHLTGEQLLTIDYWVNQQRAQTTGATA